MRHLLPFVILALPIAAAGQQQAPAKHDISWYVAHAGERNTTLRWCHGDASHADIYDCQNAEAAAAGTMFQDKGNNNAADMNSPAYWAANPVARAGTLRACIRRQPGDQMELPFCGAAAYSLMQERRGQ
jgi:hypothetical protein